MAGGRTDGGRRRRPGTPEDARQPRPRGSLLLLAVEVQDGEERLLRHLDAAKLLHTLLALLLLLEQLPLARDVATVALREYVLALRLHGLARDHARSDRGLDRHAAHLSCILILT